jgi:hypothetical protein
MPWAWRKTAWEVALCAEGSGFDSINQSINVTPVAMKLKKLMPAIH